MSEGRAGPWYDFESRPVERYPQELNMHILSQQGEAYSPDRVWHVFGDGAAERLRGYLNALERDLQEALAALGEADEVMALAGNWRNEQEFYSRLFASRRRIEALIARHRKEDE